MWWQHSFHQAGSHSIISYWGDMKPILLAVGGRHLSSSFLDQLFIGSARQRGGTSVFFFVGFYFDSSPGGPTHGLTSLYQNHAQGSVRKQTLAYATQTIDRGILLLLILR